MHARRGARQQRHGARGLHRGGFDGLRHAQPLAVHLVPVLHGLVARVQPLPKLLEVVAGEELRDPAHRAADSTVPQHHAVGLRPVRSPQRDRLRVEIGELQRALELLEGGVARGERLHEAAQLVRLQRLLQAGIAALHSTRQLASIHSLLDVFVVSRIAHSPVVTHVLQPGQARLAALRHMLRDRRVIHADLGEYAVVRRPAVIGAVRVLLIVFQVQELGIAHFAERDFRRSDVPDPDHTATDQIEDVGDRRRADLRADLLVQRLAELLVQLDEGIRTAALPSVRLELLAGLSDVAVIEHDRGCLHAVLAEIALQKSPHGSDPAFTAILDHIVNWGLGGIRTLHESQCTR